MRRPRSEKDSRRLLDRHASREAATAGESLPAKRSYDPLLSLEERLASAQAVESSSSSSGSDSDDEPPESMGTSSGSSRRPTPYGEGRPELPKRPNANMPAVMSTKRPVSHFREVIEVQRRETRDPRFDSLAGKFNEDMFKKSFSFVNDLKQSEIKDLRERIKACDDRDVKEDLKEELRHLIDETKREKNEDRRKQLHRDIKKREVEMVKQGKKPYFLKKSEAKKLELADRFQRIKDPQQLERVIEKRRKKNAAKEERGLPYRNRYGN